MLAALETVKWASLDDAYGNATKVPGYLRSLVSSDGGARAEGLRSLRGAVNHQGMITEAAVAIVPFLIELVGSSDVLDRGALLGLLADIAVGGDHTSCLMQGFDASAEIYLNAPPDHPVKQAHEAVMSGFPGFLPLLEDEDPGVRSGVGLLLSFLSRGALQAQPLVVQRIASESNAEAQASAVLCSGYLAGYSESALQAPPAQSDTPSGDPTDPKLVDVAVALAQAHVARVVPGAPALGLAAVRLLLSIVGDGRPLPSFPWRHGEMANFATLALVRHAAQSADVSLLLEVVDAGRELPSIPLAASALLDVAFGGAFDGTLSDAQRQALQLLLETRLIPSVRSALGRNGLHQSEDVLQRLLAGSASDDPLDAVVDGRPLWAHVTAVLSGNSEPSQWLATLGELPAEQALAVCLAALESSALCAFPPEPRSHEVVLRRGRLTQLMGETLAALVPWGILTEAAESLLEQPVGSAKPGADGRCAAVALALFTISARGDAGAGAAQLPPRFDALIASGLAEAHAPSMRSVLAGLPASRRDALILRLPFRHITRSDAPKQVFWIGAWLYADLSDSSGVLDKLLDSLKTWKVVPESLERPVAVFQALGQPAIDKLRFRTGAPGPERRAALALLERLS